MDNLNIFRPQSLDEFVGNEKIIKILKIYLFSAKKRNCPLDHMLLYGPPGVGKTSLAYIVGNELNQHLVTINAPVLKTVTDLLNLIVTINEGDILFIDEIHRIPKDVEEVLYSVIEDFRISINYKSNENNKVINLKVPPFTLIGATTLIGKVSLPLRERFPIIFKLNSYSINELVNIIKNNIIKIDLNIDDAGIIEIAKRSRCIPRVANNYVRRIYDFSLYYKIKNLNKDFIIKRFVELEIDDLGLTNDDYNFIRILYEDFNNKPVSIDSIALKMNDNSESLIELSEQFLLLINIVIRTKQGRKLTNFGKQIYLERIKKC